jgi:hypothetical protein
MKTQKASRAFEAAIKRDCAWFQSNPARTRLRRKVTGRELPRSLRRLGIAEVVIERAGPAHFVRTFLNANGRTVASGFDQYMDQIVPGAPGHTITFSPGPLANVDRADVTSADREYFEWNPESTEYERDALPVELEQAQVTLGYKPPRSGWVRVQQLAPGVRVRELVATSE